MDLAPGETHLQRPIVVPKGSTNFEIRGDPAGSTLVLDDTFAGSAAIVVEDASDVAISGFTVRGNRKALKSEWYLPLKEEAFADFYKDNGIVVRNSSKVVVRDVEFRLIRAFPVLIN